MRLTAVTIIAILLALLLLDVVQAKPAVDCYGTNLPSYSDYKDPVVKQKWDEFSRLTEGVCRLISRPPAPDECKFAVSIRTVTNVPEPVTLCWYGEPASQDPRVLGVTSGTGQLNFNNLITVLKQLLGNQWIIQLNVGTTMPSPDCYATNLPSYSEIIQPGVKENWDEHSRLSQGVCRIDGRPPRQNECKFTFQLGRDRGAENSWLCWYGDS